MVGATVANAVPAIMLTRSLRRTRQARVRRVTGRRRATLGTAQCVRARPRGGWRRLRGNALGAAADHLTVDEDDPDREAAPRPGFHLALEGSRRSGRRA